MKLIWDTYYAASPRQATEVCGPFWWRDVFKLFDKFCMLAAPEVHSGETVLFWLDKWKLQGRFLSMKDRFPRLHSYVVDDLLTVKATFELPSVTSNLHLPLSSEAHQELMQL